MIYFLIGAAVLMMGVLGVKNDVITPSFYDATFKKYGSLYAVDWLMLKRIAKIESNIGLAPSVLRGLAVPSDVEGSKSSDGNLGALCRSR